MAAGCAFAPEEFASMWRVAGHCRGVYAISRYVDLMNDSLGNGSVAQLDRAADF